MFPRFAEYATKLFGFDMILPMNTGAEAVETAVKIARKWGYKVKGIPQNEALIFSVEENFHGRTVSVLIPITFYVFADSPNLVCCNHHVDRS